MIDYATSPTLHTTIEQYHQQLCDLNRKYMYAKCHEVNSWGGLDRLIDSHIIGIINTIKQWYFAHYQSSIDNILLHDISQFLRELFNMYHGSTFEHLYHSDGISYDTFLQTITAENKEDGISYLQDELIKCCINSNGSHSLTDNSYQQLHTLIQCYITTNFYTTTHSYIEKINTTRGFLLKELSQYKTTIRQEIEK